MLPLELEGLDDYGEVLLVKKDVLGLFNLASNCQKIDPDNIVTAICVGNDSYKCFNDNLFLLQRSILLSKRAAKRSNRMVQKGIGY